MSEHTSSVSVTTSYAQGGSAPKGSTSHDIPTYLLCYLHTDLEFKEHQHRNEVQVLSRTASRSQGSNLTIDQILGRVEYEDQYLGTIPSQ